MRCPRRARRYLNPQPGPDGTLMKPTHRLDDPDGAIRGQILGLDGPPAFMRRARQVQDAQDAILERCRRQREEWLHMVRLRLATLAALAGDWQLLRGCLGDD